MLERIKYMLIKEFIQIFRDPKMRALIFLVPIIQTLLFGYAVTMDVKHVKIGVYDLDNTIASRVVISSYIHSGYFQVVTYINNESEIDDLLNSGEVLAVFQINKGFEDLLHAGEPAEFQVIIDGVDSNTASIVQNYILRIAYMLEERYLVIHPMTRQHSKRNQVLKIDLMSRAWFNDNLESRNYYVPGVLATLVTLMTLTLTSMAIVREKEIGTMEQIIVTPITSFEFILGKVVPFICIGFLDVILIVIVGVFWFEVPIRGSIFILFLAVSLYLLTTLGIGLFISSISQTQQQAMMSAFLFYFPAVLLSGFLFPISNMPPVIQWLTYVNPLKYFMYVIRGVFLKGVGLKVLWPHLLTMGLMGCFTLWQASRFFRKKMS